MIRAVSRYTLEINKTGSPYFERAICFVKPEYAQSDRLDLHRAAQQLISEFDAGVEENSAQGELFTSLGGVQNTAPPQGTPLARTLRRLLPLALSAAIGAGVTLLVMLLI